MRSLRPRRELIADEPRKLGLRPREGAVQVAADLERLKDVVQMECVVYPAPAQPKPESASGAAYLRNKAEALRMMAQQADQVRAALGALAREVRVREVKNGTRIFVLIERGREGEFRSVVERVGVPEQLSRRVSGPWPAAEFLSEQVRAPNGSPCLLVVERMARGPEISDKDADGLVSEARAASSLQHANVLRGRAITERDTRESSMQ